MCLYLGMKESTYEIINNAEQKVSEQFKITDEIKEFNQEKVLDAFIKNILPSI